MDQKEFLHFLKHKTPNHPSYEIIPRPYKNAKGVDEIITLMRTHWDLVAWLESNAEIKFSEWVVHCDKHPHEGMTLSHQLMYWLWFEECERFRRGMPTPNPYPPMGYGGWTDEYHAKASSS